MKKKTVIITSILLITIALIGTLKFLIRKDTIQIKQERLNFFSQNLISQKNNTISTLKNYSDFIVEGIINDSTLINSIRQINSNDEFTRTKLINQIVDQSNFYSKQLERAGLTSLSYLITNKNTPTVKISIPQGTSTMREPLTIEENYLHKKNTVTESWHSDNGIVEYNFTYPIVSLDKNKEIDIVTGFDLAILQNKIAENLPNTLIGILKIGEKQTTFNLDGFVQIDKNTPVAIDKLTAKKIEEQFSPRILKKIYSLLLSGSVTSEDMVLYISGKKHPMAISINPLTSHANQGKIYLFSINYDFVLDKTNDWNSQIFIINLIIIILIMMGITYLFINRINLLKQKKFIEESEMKLKEMNKSKDKFFSIIAHDLKNPFNGIMGMTGYLNESYDMIDDVERKEIINDLNISSKNAFNLLQNLLEWTRAQSGTIKNVPVKIEPATIIEIALETVSNLAKNKELTIKQTIATSNCGYADENLVSTVLRNLLTNAVKFSPRNSTIEINVKHFESELVFCVIDNGIGLRHDEIDQLFRIDVNFHKKGTEEETGTGLGLKLCKEFVEYCHGRIWVISEPQKGSQFFFTIPLYPC